MPEVQLMHAGEEALFVLVPVAIVLLVDYRKRRKEKREALAAAPGATPADGESGSPETPAE
jgi:hypothetical protein